MNSTAAPSTERTRWLPALVGLALLFVAGIWGIQRYVAYEQARDLDHWRQRLDLVADDRLSDVSDWLDGQWRIVNELAGNASVQLYLDRIGARSSDEDETGLAAVTYLRNLLVATAERAGLRAEAAIRVPANLAPPSGDGVALLDTEGRLITATPGFPRPTDQDSRLAREIAHTGKPTLRDLREDGDHHTLGLLAPVPPPPGKGSRTPVGIVYLLRLPARDLFPLLRPHSSDAANETLLVERRDNEVVYVSPQGDGTPPLRRRLDIERRELAAVHAVLHPGTFAIRRDYAGRQVLMTSRRITRTPWVLLQKTLAQSALRESRQHARFLYLSFSLALLLTLVAVIAAWRHGSSRRAERLAGELAEQSRLLENQRRLLQTVTDHIDDFILLLDEAGHVVFANLPLARRLGAEPDTLRGKTLSSILGPGTARLLSPCLQGEETPSEAILTLPLGETEGEFLCRSTPLPDCVQADRLVVLHDVTALREAERKRARLFDQLLAALMRAIDRHDPWSAGHSERTARVARAIAEEMKLPEADIRQLELAARLANIGKILVPKEILTKTAPLTPEEQEIMRRHVDHAVDILSHIDFDGPVVEIIAQKQEHMDGSGYPKGLRDGEILLPARILAVANAFVALVSPRAYREAVGIDEALERLMAETPDKYDRHVVAALFHVAENVLRPEDLVGGPEAGS